MAKLIFKVNYFKPNHPKSRGGYARYIATRDGVEKDDSHKLMLKATDKQEELIEKLTKDFPSSLGTDEYSAYKESPTVGNATDYISATIEDNLSSIINSPTYADYIATRPRAERIGSHGLFSSGDEPIVLSKVSEELNNHQGNVWTIIASLKREDAERLGFDNAARWKSMIGSQVCQIASNMRIPVENLKWYGAFHNEGNHPHVHIIVYSTNPKEGYITKVGIDKLRSCFAQDIFAQDLQSLYEDQTEIRQKLKERFSELLKEILAEADGKGIDNVVIEQKLTLLSDKLKTTKGKKVYGYLSRDIKDIVDSIVDELAKDETIRELYDLWYDYKFRILGMYSSHRPIMKPLSDNQEFKSIKNAIIKEALHLNQDGEKKQYSSKQLSSEKHRVSAIAVTRLFKNLCGIFRDKFDDENRRTIYTHAVDKRIRREDEAKRNAEILYD